MGQKVSALTVGQVAKFPIMPHRDESFTWHIVPVRFGTVLVGLCSNDLLYYIVLESKSSRQFSKAINAFLGTKTPESQVRFVFCSGRLFAA